MRALDGKVAVIAGGGTGIGRATAELFAAEGARVVVFGRRAAPLEETVAAIRRAGGDATGVCGDVGREEDVDRLLAATRSAWGGIDVLVNSAAVRLRGPLTEISAADFAEVLRVNLVGAFILTRGVVPLMRERGGGSIVHIGSALGTVAVGQFAPYVASKGGLHQLARAAAVELVPDGIRVNVVAPGTIDTAIGEVVADFRRRLLAHRIPIGRAGVVGDVAQACLYLASDASRYVTGSVLAVDGGWTAS
ncbi:MAG: SDR family oxidoreductase [Candidatus Rokubacteria bacterium]|nr:SDR family oxidoreductase [Candidatus Rokubacteria bacterium]